MSLAQPLVNSIYNLARDKFCFFFYVAFILFFLFFRVCSTSVAEYNLATLPHFFELFNVTGYASAIKPDILADGTIMRDFIIENKRGEVVFDICQL